MSEATEAEAIAAAFARIEALQTELEQAQRSLAARGPIRGCGTPEHATASARIEELTAALRQHAGERRGTFQRRLNTYRLLRLRDEVARLAKQLAETRMTANGDPRLLAELKAVRDRRRTLLGDRRRSPTPAGFFDPDQPPKLEPSE